MTQRMLLFYGGMGGVALALHLAFGGSLDSMFAPAQNRAGGAAGDLAIGVAVGLGAVLLTRGLSARFRWARTVEREFREVLTPLRANGVFIAAFSSSMAEEMFFRGFLQPHLGLIGASLLFGLAHLPHRRDMIPWTLSAVAVGLAFGGIFELRGSLIGPIAAHFTVNYFNLHHLLGPAAREQT